MTRTAKIVGLIAALVLTFGAAAFATTPDWAQATEEEFLVLRQEVPPLGVEVAMLDAHLHSFTAPDGSETRPLGVPFTPECIGLSDALMVDGAARGLCR